ncbi:MAG: helix-turn-helix domain-containing protein [Phycisphaerae bacterium]|nr:helix-turn-helix domain-containing protein [Phycisphaerae bacterium]
MTNYVYDNSPVKGSALLVLLALADRADDRGICWPAISDVARRSRLGERATRKNVRKLVDVGELRIVRPGGGRKRSGDGWTNLYLIVAGRPESELDAVISTLNGGSGYSTDPNHEQTRREPGTVVPSTLNGGSVYPEPPFRGTVNRTNSEPSRREPTGRSVCSSKGGTVTAAVDPHAAEFNRLLGERRADEARLSGGCSPTPLARQITQVVDSAKPRASPRGTKRRGRIPEAEQRRTYELLGGVPDLLDADARDLARIGTEAEFRRALELMDGKHPRNIGGWLRTAVTDGW